MLVSDYILTLSGAPPFACTITPPYTLSGCIYRTLVMFFVFGNDSVVIEPVRTQHHAPPAAPELWRDVVVLQEEETCRERGFCPVPDWLRIVRHPAHNPRMFSCKYYNDPANDLQTTCQNLGNLQWLPSSFYLWCAMLSQLAEWYQFRSCPQTPR